MISRDFARIREFNRAIVNYSTIFPFSAAVSVVVYKISQKRARHTAADSALCNRVELCDSFVL